jgi:hypothetical protein
MIVFGLLYSYCTYSIFWLAERSDCTVVTITLTPIEGIPHAIYVHTYRSSSSGGVATVQACMRAVGLEHTHNGEIERTRDITVRAVQCSAVQSPVEVVHERSRRFRTPADLFEIEDVCMYVCMYVLNCTGTYVHIDRRRHFFCGSKYEYESYDTTPPFSIIKSPAWTWTTRTTHSHSHAHSHSQHTLLPCMSILLILLLLLHCCAVFTSAAAARHLDSRELSVGVWNVTMKCKRSSFTSDVFPPREAREQQQQQRQRQWLPSWGGGVETSQSFDCQLNLFSNGTFALQPRDEKYWTRLLLAGSDGGSSGSQSHTTQHPPLPTPTPPHTRPYLAIHGRWKVHSNPYCVTDRSYDEVSLVSKPRVQTRSVAPTNKNTKTAKHTKHKNAKSKHKNAEQSAADKEAVQDQPQGQDKTQDRAQPRRLRLLMQCRLSGHCTNGGLARRLVGDAYARGRITRGVMILSRDQDQDQDGLGRQQQQQQDSKSNTNKKPWWQSHNKVVASFSARRHIPPGFSLDEDDLLE